MLAEPSGGMAETTGVYTRRSMFNRMDLMSSVKFQNDNFKLHRVPIMVGRASPNVVYGFVKMMGQKI